MIRLSVLIPARNEEFLSRTVQDLIDNTTDETEILVGLDGYWPEPGVPDHPRVRILYVPEAIGQRAMQNRLAEMSQAKYLAKTDAHCAFDHHFDKKLMDAMEDDITMVPVMRNLHVFNWVCDGCGMETYQGPQPEQCRNEMCANEPQSHHKDIVWIPKTNPQSSAYRFNKNLQFKYFPELRNKLPREGLQETMSLQGSFFMCTREKYWELKLCDESWGSWGQQGSEVAIKTWLSGGRVLCNMDTWYAHLFRTQHGFSFPYPMNGNDQKRARKISQDVFLNDKWDKAVHPLNWLLEKFWFALADVQDTEARWELSDIKKMSGEPTKGIIFYTDNQLKLKIAHKVQQRLRNISKLKGIPIVSTSLKPMPKMGKNIVIKGERGVDSYFRQIITALDNLDTDIVFFCEHDVFYDASHFDFTPLSDKFYYNTNVWRLRTSDGLAVTWEANQVAELVCDRQKALDWYRQKYEEFKANGNNRSYEPGGRDPSQYGQFKSILPNIDIRHGGNLTKSKWSPNDFRDKSTCVNWQETAHDQLPIDVKDFIDA